MCEAIHSIGSSKEIFRSTKWEVLEGFKRLFRKALIDLNISAKERDNLYKPIRMKQTVSKEHLKALPAFHALEKAGKAFEVLEFLETHNYIEPEHPFLRPDACIGNNGEPKP